MGRSENSFTHWVGNALGMDGDRVTLPEKELWVAVLSRAALDACKGPPRLNLSLSSNVTHQHYYTVDRAQARHFFMNGGSHFNLICELAGRDPDYVQQRVRKIILRKEGWNVDVPVTSHYRQGPRKGRRRGRPRKSPYDRAYYVAMGKKGGRPKMYNHV